MNIRIRAHVDDRAEGDCAGFPYNTELVSSEGVSILFWVGEGDPDHEPTKTQLAAAVRVAMRNRDIVCVYACPGNPTSYWAHQNMREG